MISWQWPSLFSTEGVVLTFPKEILSQSCNNHMLYHYFSLYVPCTSITATWVSCRPRLHDPNYRISRHPRLSSRTPTFIPQLSRYRSRRLRRRSWFNAGRRTTNGLWNIYTEPRSLWILRILRLSLFSKLYRTLHSLPERISTRFTVLLLAISTRYLFAKSPSVLSKLPQPRIPPYNLPFRLSRLPTSVHPP
jgi:hypothetical protein